MSANVAIQLTPEFSSTPSKPPRFGTTVDLWLIGGASLVWFLGCHLLANNNSYHVDDIFLVLVWVCNWPHIGASYELLYRDNLAKIWRDRGFFIAGVVVPVLILGTMVAGIWLRSQTLFGNIIQALYFIVGWHYAGQTFGIVIVSSAAEGYFFAKAQRRILQFALLSIVLTAFVGHNISTDIYHLHTLEYQRLGFPLLYAKIGNLVTLALFFTLAYVAIRRFARDGRWPAPMAIIALLSFVVWFLPFFYQARFYYMVPFFHGLQYMTFYHILRRNQWREQFASLLPEEVRLATIKSYLKHFGTAIAIGGLGFGLIPHLLNWYASGRTPVATVLWGGEVFGALFYVFLNLHHFLIDAVIWRKGNPDMRYLFDAAN